MKFPHRQQQRSSDNTNIISDSMRRRLRWIQRSATGTGTSSKSSTSTSTSLFNAAPSSASTTYSSPSVNGNGNSNDHLLTSQHQQRMEQIAYDFVEEFQTAWNGNDVSKVLECFVDDDRDEEAAASTTTQTPFWRDMVAFTWNICTMEGKSDIEQGLSHVFENSRKDVQKSDPSKSTTTKFQVSSKPQSITIIQDRIEFWCDMTIPNVGTGKAHFRLLRQQPQSSNNRQYKIHTLLTTLYELHGRQFQIGSNRIRGAIHGPTPNRKYWDERLHDQHHQHLLDNSKSIDDDDLDSGYYPIVIIGGGQAGLSLAARLQYLDIPYVVLESGSKPGIAWRKRYPSLHLHDPVWYNHMPYLPFPETWPMLCPRNKIADWMEFYAIVLDLHVQTNQKVTNVVKSNNNGEWIVKMQETKKNDDDNEVASTTTTRKTIRAKHVVFATGNSSHPRIPKLPGIFYGVQIHSSQYRGGREFSNKNVVVVGSNNSGFDIVQDLWEQGAKHVTMIQRSPSLVVSTESVLKHGLGPLYRQDAPLHHEDADLVATAMPYKLLLPRWSSVTSMMKETDAELHEGLIAAGYRLDFGPNGTGVFAKSATEGGGFYINMGAAELVINGDVSIRYATVSRLQEDGIVIVDQDTQQEEFLQADVIVYATGFHTMDSWVADLCGEEISNRMGRTWGLGYGKRPHKDPGPWEGELRNMWKPTTVEGLWFHGGNLAQSRHYSRFLALQLAARYLGFDTPVHGIPNPTPSPPRGTQ